MAQPENDLDPNEFVIVPAVYMLDEFIMTDDDGNVVAQIDAVYIRKLVARMNERERTTGDLCPIVIGHTEDNPQGGDEVSGPPLIGYLRNWVQIPFFDTGKTAAAADAWIFKKDVERARRYPRRSGEVWVFKYEIDPMSFLGATTPARDLGMLKLSARMSLKVLLPVVGGLFDSPKHVVRLARDCNGNCPLPPTNRERENPMADAMVDSKIGEEEGKQAKPPADPKESGSMKEVMGRLSAIESMIQKLVDGQAGGAQQAGAQPTPAGAAGAEGEEAPLSDEELQAMLGGAFPEGGEEEEDEEDEEDPMKKKSRKGEEVVKNSTGYAGGNDTQSTELVKKLSRQTEQQAEELAVVRRKLARADVKEMIADAVKAGARDLDPKDEQLVTDLVILPEEERTRMLKRLSRSKSMSARTGGHAAEANEKTAVKGKRAAESDKPAIIKLARKKGIMYEEAAQELGFIVGTGVDQDDE